MATIQYTKFSFRTPPLLTQHEFDMIKKVIRDNPKYKLCPSSNFLENFKMYLILIGIGAFGLIIALMEISNVTNWIFGIIAFIGLGQLFSFVPSFFSFLEYTSDKSSYYNKLRKDIIKSTTYSEFLSQRK